MYKTMLKYIYAYTAIIKYLQEVLYESEKEIFLKEIHCCRSRSHFMCFCCSCQRFDCRKLHRNSQNSHFQNGRKLCRRIPEEL